MISNFNGAKGMHIFNPNTENAAFSIMRIGQALSGANYGSLFMNSSTNTQYGGPDSFNLVHVPNGRPLTLGTSNSVRMTIAGGGNVGIGTNNPDYKLEVHGPIFIGNASTPPVIGGKAGLFNSGGELFSQDGAGNSTHISPHNPDTGEWIFYSKNIKTGRVVRVNMERLIKKLEQLTGEQYIEEWIEDPEIPLYEE